MASIEKFEDIEARQKARELTREIYRVTNQGAFAKDFGLRDQIRRASVSIMSNIAEGFGRGGNREFVQFLRRRTGRMSWQDIRLRRGAAGALPPPLARRATASPTASVLAWPDSSRLLARGAQASTADGHPGRGSSAAGPFSLEAVEFGFDKANPLSYTPAISHGPKWTLFTGAR
jgi:hypothetical protein